LFLLLALSAMGLLFVVRSATAQAANGALNFDMKEYERARVLKAADQYLTEEPITITAYPATRSAGGPHDYYSEADYDWPNPKDPNGPYIGRDGYSNPENFVAHRAALIRMSIQVPALTAAYLLTGEERYAKHAVEHLHAWFVDPATRINPSLLYSQAIRNKYTGRSIGIIDTLHLVEVARSIALLRDRHMLGADEAPMMQWFTDYLKWMTTHPYGIQEGNAKNNHATCYWLQVAEFSILTGNQDEVAEARKRFKEQLFPQMAADGSFPQELKRTKPYCYSMFNLDQMVMLAQVLSTPQDDLWNFALPNGATLHTGLEFLYPYVKDKSKWPPNPSVHAPDVMWWEFWPVRSCSWLYGGIAYNEPKYIDLWKSLEANPTNEEVLRNLPIRQPVIWLIQQ
jgi:hypothetical protein